ncbi:CsbD family protein [Streptomyces sp. NPDC091292]|uniref:CsbD family protein n=1 Tax=Streptomyces sp. NPDC091292 TaxID=3365991 RepID=UPI0037F427BF
MGEGAKDKAKGKAKEMMGKATGDDRMQAEGKTDKAKGTVRDAAQSGRDKAKGVRDSLKHDDK